VLRRFNAIVKPERIRAMSVETKPANTVVLGLLAAALALGLSACNTVRGAGEDLESAANEVDEEI